MTTSRERRRFRGMILLLTTMTFAVIGEVRAGVLFENTPALADSFATTADVDGRQWSADDFKIEGEGAYALTTLTWWGRFSGLTIPSEGSSNFVVELYSKSSGTGPDVSPWYQATLGPVQRTLAGVAGGVSLFEFTAQLTAPVIVQGGQTYFASIFNDNGVDDERFAILWSSTSGASNPRWFRQNPSSPWTLSGSNVNTAFRIEGQAVPEPSSVVLLGAATLVLGGIVHRRRR